VKCGTPYKPPAAPEQPIDGLYTERYAELAPPEPVVVAGPPRRRSNTSYLIWGGVGLIGCAFVVALLFELGTSGGSAQQTNPYVPGGVVGGGATPTATLPATIAMTLKQLNDPNFSARISIQSRVQLSADVAAKAQVMVLRYDGIVSDGNQWGTLRNGQTSAEAMLVDGVAYLRTAPTKWATADVVPPYRVVCPVFGLKTVNDLSMIGQETLHGVKVNHLQSTNWWKADISRVSLVDLSALRIPPDVETLDLWVLPDGTPVSAKFSGTNMAGNTTLIDIEVTFTFTQVGAEQVIAAPGPHWTPSPAPTPTPGPSASASASASAS
jgi:hypothetical protein